MMDYKQIFDNFKQQYMPDGFFPFSLFPVLFREFIRYGADRSIITESFIADFNATFLPGAPNGLILRSIHCIQHYSDEFLPSPLKTKPIEPKKEQKTETPTVKQEIPEQKSKPVVKREPAKIKTQIEIDYDEDIPSEEEEGDGLFTPEEERISVKPNECAPKQYDWDWIKRIGAVGFEEK